MHGVRTRDVALVAAGALAAAVVAGVPLGSLVPLLAVGGCLLMHLVMMRHMGHRSHGSEGGAPAGPPPAPEDAEQRR